MTFQSKMPTPKLSRDGLIAIDEHTSAACMIRDVTPTGLSLTVLDGSEIPGVFMLTAGAEMRVCRVVQRSDETIEASFADLASTARRAAVPVRAPAYATVQPRYATQSFGLRRAA